MTSAYLERPVRTKAHAIGDIIATLAPTYVIVAQGRNGLYMAETDLGAAMGSAVYDLATKQIDKAVAVLCIHMDGRTENVSEKVARSLLDYLKDRDLLYDENGVLILNEFLEYAWPDWVYQVPRGNKAPQEYEP